MNIKPFKYNDPVLPEGYSCSQCKVDGVKLWRQYQTLADRVELLCACCSLTNQKLEGPVGPDGKRMTEHGMRSDSIGWLVPAVPTEEGDTFWGYTSVPQPGVTWWRKLPTEKPC